MYYTDTVTIPNYICDQYDHIALWGLARLFQESAGHHAETAGMGFRQLIERGKAWVLSRMYYVIDRMPCEGETVTVRTWSRGTDGLFAFRDFQLIDSQGVAATCSTYWVIIDFDTRRAVRIRDYWAAIATHPDCATDRQQLDRLRLPKDAQPETVAHFSVKPSMLDHTFHVNNAEYIKWIMDNLPPQAPAQAPYRFSIEFLNETQPHESVSVIVCPTQPHDGAATYFKVTNDRATAVVAAIEPVMNV